MIGCARSTCLKPLAVNEMAPLGQLSAIVQRASARLSLVPRT